MNSDFKILLLDPNTELVSTLSNALQQEGFRVVTPVKAKEVIPYAVDEKPHLILLEVIMPERDGIHICEELRLKPELINTLIVFYTDCDDYYSQIAAFNAGADDYIVKPVKLRVLISRVKALLKRHTVNQNKIIQNELIGLTIDRERYVVFMNDREIILPRKEFELLALLSSSPQKVFTRKEISEVIWGYEFIAKNRTIDVHIRKIREKLGGRYIKTIKGVGYSLGG